MIFRKLKREKGVLTINPLKGNRSRFRVQDFLKLHGTIFIRKIDEETPLETQKLQVVPGLDPVLFVQLTDRLELEDNLAVDYDIGPDVSDILTRVKNRDDPFGLIVHSGLSESDLKGTMVHGLGIARAK